jgi:hypothetical protein
MWVNGYLNGLAIDDGQMNLSPRWGLRVQRVCVPGVETPGYCIESLSGQLIIALQL